MDRTLWEDRFSEDKWPSWPCPNCGKGHLHLDKGSYAKREPGWSKDAHSHDAWDPDWIAQRFTAFLVCSRKECSEEVAVCGAVEVVYRPSYEEEDWPEYVIPDRLFPAPPIINLPTETPEKVEKEAKAAFGNFWSDVNASANSLRRAVEEVLTEKGVPRTTLTKRRKRQTLNLNDRIAKLNGDAESKETLHALREVGNVGSHSGTVNRTVLLDAFELFEDLLSETYEKRKKKLKAMRTAIRKRKGKPALKKRPKAKKSKP